LQTKGIKGRDVGQPILGQALRDLLIKTGSARLVECATVDNEVNRLWGEVNGKGKNMLGVLLMEVRQKLISVTCLDENGDIGQNPSDQTAQVSFSTALAKPEPLDLKSPRAP
jgi:hypothetical protein